MPWEELLIFSTAEEQVKMLAKGFTAEAVDYAFRGTEYETFLPDNFRGAWDRHTQRLQGLAPGQQQHQYQQPQGAPPPQNQQAAPPPQTQTAPPPQTQAAPPPQGEANWGGDQTTPATDQPATQPADAGGGANWNAPQGEQPQGAQQPMQTGAMADTPSELQQPAGAPEPKGDAVPPGNLSSEEYTDALDNLQKAQAKSSDGNSA